MMRDRRSSRGMTLGRERPHFYSKIGYLILYKDQLVLRQVLVLEQVLHIQQCLKSLMNTMIMWVLRKLQLRRIDQLLDILTQRIFAYHTSLSTRKPSVWHL